MTISDQELLAAEAAYGLKDLYYFNSHIMQFGRERTDGSLFQMPENEAGPICQWLQAPWPAYLSPDARRFRALVLPRGTTKTSIVSGYIAQRLLQNPNISVFYTSELKALATLVVSDIGARLDSPLVVERYGEQRAHKGWRDDKFFLGTRTKKRKDPSLMSGGVDVPAQGSHYNLIVADDLQGRTNRSPDGIANVKEYLRLLVPILDPGGEIIYIGTRWDFDDVLSQIMQQWKDDKSTWELPGKHGFFGAYARPGDEEFFPWLKAAQWPEEGNLPLFPSVLSHAELSRLKSTMSLNDFSCQYLNDPLPVELAEFDPGDFQYVKDYDPDDELFQGMTVFAGVDLATGEAMIDGDDNVIAIIGVKGSGVTLKIIVLDMIGGQWKSAVTVQRLIDAYQKWRPRLVAVEANGSQIYVVQNLRDKLRELDMGTIPIREIKGALARNAKAERIRGISPFYREHKVFHCAKLKDSKLEIQLRRFKPGGAGHDDYPDALAMAIGQVPLRAAPTTRPKPMQLFPPRYRVTGY